MLVEALSSETSAKLKTPHCISRRYKAKSGLLQRSPSFFFLKKEFFNPRMTRIERIYTDFCFPQMTQMDATIFYPFASARRAMPYAERHKAVGLAHRYTRYSRSFVPFASFAFHHSVIICSIRIIRVLKLFRSFARLALFAFHPWSITTPLSPFGVARQRG